MQSPSSPSVEATPATPAASTLPANPPVLVVQAGAGAGTDKTDSAAHVEAGGQRYESIRNDSHGRDEDDDDNDQHRPHDPAGLSPHAGSDSAWASLARRQSDQSTTGDFELQSVNDRTGLTSDRPSLLSPQDSQEDLHLQPPGQSRRHRGFHRNHASGASGTSSLRPKSTHSSTSTSRLASVKQVLGRASTRVVNLSGSSRSQPPPVPDIAAVYTSKPSEDDEEEDEEDEQKGLDLVARASHESIRTATSGAPQDPSKLSKTSLPLTTPHGPPQPVLLDPVSFDPPLEGWSLFIFGPENPIRQKINRFLNQTWVELFLLFLLVVNLLFLVIKVSSPKGNDTVWGAHWTDYGLLIIFVLYTMEIGSRIIVSGLVLYPKDGDKVRKFFGKKPRTDNLHDTNPTILRKSPEAQRRFGTMAPSATFKSSAPAAPINTATKARATTIIDFAVGRQTTVTQFIPTYMDPLIAYKPQFVAEAGTQIPFLRHTFNRIDFFAVLCYWIDFFLMMAGVKNIYFFKTVAAMRTLRLLNITSGSATILHSLKKSAPLLVNIALFIAFFFIIFSIIGVQAFKGSLSRRCVLAANETEVLEDQFCGGHYDLTRPYPSYEAYITKSGELSQTSPKGHICSHGYICKDIGVNMEGAISFDTIYAAMVPVYVLMTGQTWTDLTYKIMDAEYSWSSIYFVVVVLIMNFWILNLFVAVINEMFAKIRDDSSHNSAFTSDSSTDNKNAILRESVHNFTYAATMLSRRKQWVDSLECVWVAAVIVDLVFQCMPRYNSSPERLEQLAQIELWFTLAFAVDIIIRLLVCLPNPSDFLKSRKNMVDLFLVVTTLIIQIPPIRRSHVYMYLTVFQVLRIYRPIIYIERLRSLIQRVVGSWIGLLNLIFFIAMFLGVVSVMAGLLFREIIGPDYKSPMTFSDFYVSYLGMYQLFSGENWTDILYNVISAELPYGQAIVATVFIIAFYSFANFVLVNMLIAIIMENFEGGAEVGKHAQQILDFASKSGYAKEEERKFVIYLTKYLKPYPKSIGVNPVQSGWVQKMRKGLARQFLLGDTELFHGVEKDPLLKESSDAKKKRHRRSSSQKSDYGFESHQSVEIEDTADFRKLFATPAPGYEELDSAQDGTKKRQPFFSPEAFRHRSLFIFGPHNKFRRFLQRFVTPGKGHRIQGASENVLLSRPFNLFITLAIIACVIVAAITTPVWRLKETNMPREDQSVVIRISDFVFPAVFTAEFLIRVIADGFIFTPDAYLKSLWNKIDFFVLLTLYAPLVANLTNSQGASRFFRALKALRALRLINQSAYIRGTFHAVLVAGFPQLFDATMLSMTLIVPFAIYGMRLFSGLFFSCNDTSDSVQSLNECVGTFLDPESGLLKPRIWSNPVVYSFDNFGASFLILFEIVSQEGWTGVMESARNIVGLGLQPQQDASRYNGIFFVLFNLAGGYFVSALFVAIVIENYTKRTGTAFMTANQRRWMDLKKLLGGIRMKKSKSTPPGNPFRKLCFSIASPKRGWFARLLTIATVLNGILLATEHVDSGDWEGIKNWLFLALLSVFMIEIVVKVAGLGWHAYRKSRWNIYNSTVSTCALLITIMRIAGVSWQPLIQTQKLFLTAILFRLVPRSDSLNQLFMTMAASMGSISSLLGVWLVVFAVYGIMFVEVFGLTAYGPNGSDNVNFRHIGTSLLVMARMSTGEGWNDLMHDFAVEKPHCVNEPYDYLLSDCGSTAWAYTLFITFNIISMYIFTNMFIVVVMHNFSYVYQIAPGFSLITREEIRGFKRVWSEVDKDHKGYIQEKDLALFLMKLRGVFDMRVYNEEHSILKLKSRLETAKPNAVQMSARDLEKNAGANNTRKILMLNETSRSSTLNWEENQKEKGAPGLYGKRTKARADLSYKIDQDYNLPAFNSAIANMDTTQVRQRRRLYNFLYTEVLMSMEPIPGTETRKKKGLFHWRAGSFGKGGGKNTAGDFEMAEIGGEMLEDDALRGISFQKMLNILAHYKLIEDDQCLSIGDMLRHRQKMDRIHARVNVTNVKNILLKVILRQRFLTHYRAVQRIKALAQVSSSSDDVPPSSGGSSGGGIMGSGIDPGSGSGTGSGSTQQDPRGSHSTRSSVSANQGSSSGAPNTKQKRVRINTGEADSYSAAGVGSSSTLNTLRGQTARRSTLMSEGEKTAIEEEEAIDPALAGTMINELRSEWRSFIASHDLSVPETDPMNTGLNREMTVGDLENVDLNASSTAAGQPSRREVLGLDYL